MAIGASGRATLLALGALALGLPACEPEPLGVETTIPTGSGGTTPHAGGAGGAGRVAGAAAAPPLDGAVTPVLVALDPNPRTSDGGSSSAAEVLEAELTCRAVGVRAVVLVRPWRDLTANATTELATQVSKHRAAGLSVVLNLAVVDRKMAYRPEPVASLAWDAEDTTGAMQATLDDLVAALGADLFGLVLGRETDRYALEHPDEATALTQFLSLAVSHLASIGPGAPPAGVGLSFAGPSPPADYQALLGLGQLGVFSYLPGIGAPVLPSDTSVSDDLDTMTTLAAGRPVVLEAAGQTSSTALGSSPEQQRQFFDALFGAMQARREHFALVNVHELHDRNAASCAAGVAVEGEIPESSFAAYACETGLRTPDGGPKPAWARFAEGAAAFASP
jgi:hypothetical protein